MRAPLTLAFALVLFSAACAPHTIRADVGAAWVSMDGDVGLQNEAGTLALGANKHDLDDMGLDDGDLSPFVHLQADWVGHRAQLYGYALSSSGSSVLVNAFGNIPAGSSVTSDLDYVDVSGVYSFDLLPSPDFRLAPGAHVGFYSLDITTRVAAPAGFEQVETTVFAPMPYLEAEAVFGPVTLHGDISFASADFGDADGRFFEVGAMARVAAGEKVEFLAGYRFTAIDVLGNADGRDFDADVRVTGWFLGGGIKF